MADATKRPLQIPPWQIPYLEKHRIFELFHELARELVIRQPSDHVLFLKQILYNAARNRDTSRVIFLYSPRVNCGELAREISAITKQNVMTEELLLSYSQKPEIEDPELRAQYISYALRKDNAYENGWILLDCIRDERDAKALLKIGILPTHVIHIIPPFDPPLSELLYCHVPVDWPRFRRKLLMIRSVFEKVLVEVHIQQHTFSETVAECVEIINNKPAKCAIKPRILIIGPRGSGRKSQAKLLADNQNLIHVDFERLICEVWISESELGRKLRKCNDKACFHSELLAEIINKRVLEQDCVERGWVLTGFPFTKNDFLYLDCIDTPPNRLLGRKMNVLTGSVTNVHEIPDALMTKQLRSHPKDVEEVIDAELSFFCEHYGEMKKYCGASAYVINGNQSQRWIHETIVGIILRAPMSTAPRIPFEVVSNGAGTVEGCCCSPIPSQVLDCYVTRK